MTPLFVASRTAEAINAIYTRPVTSRLLSTWHSVGVPRPEVDSRGLDRVHLFSAETERAAQKLSMDRAKEWLRVKVVNPGQEYIKNGAEPKTLAASAAVGFCNGLCPLLGVSAGLTCLFVFASRGALHGPMALLANFISVPVELALIVPYMRVGEWLTGAPHVDFSPVGLKDLILHSSTNLLKSVGRAVLAWVLTWPLLAFGLYLALAPAFQFLRRKYMMRTTGSEAGLGDVDEAELAADGEALHSTPLLPVGVSNDGSAGSNGVTSRRPSGGSSAEFK